MRLTNGNALRTILLHALDLDNSNAAAIVCLALAPLRMRMPATMSMCAWPQAEFLCGSPGLQGMSLENNNFTEDGLCVIAEVRHCAGPGEASL